MSRRIILGAFADGGFGLRCSQAGFDADANPANNDQLAFNSDWKAAFPIHWSGSVNVNSNVNVVISYSALGYMPHSDFVCQKVVTGATWDPIFTQYQYYDGTAGFVSVGCFTDRILFTNSTSYNWMFAGSVYRLQAF